MNVTIELHEHDVNNKDHIKKFKNFLYSLMDNGGTTVEIRFESVSGCKISHPKLFYNNKCIQGINNIMVNLNKLCNDMNGEELYDELLKEEAFSGIDNPDGLVSEPPMRKKPTRPPPTKQHDPYTPKDEEDENREDRDMDGNHRETMRTQNAHIEQNSSYKPSRSSRQSRSTTANSDEFDIETYTNNSKKRVPISSDLGLNSNDQDDRLLKSIFDV